MRRYRFALRPGWLALLLITVAAAVTMVFLGRWQLHVSEGKGFSIQNFGYALQWWAFSVATVAMYVRTLRDGAHKRPAIADRADAELQAITQDQPVTYRRYVMPQLSAHPQPAQDATQAAYNDYLATLAAQDASERA